MNDASRRAFLAAAGTGAVVAGVAAVAPSAQAAPQAATPHGVHVDTPVVAYVHNARKGEVAIMHGDREVIVTDHDLVARLTAPLATNGEV